MDAAGLAFVIRSSFNVMVENIRLLRDCQSFGQDYETTQLKLQLAEARLVRWGVSVGVADQDPPAFSWPEHALAAEDHHQSVDRLSIRLMPFEGRL